VTSNNTIIVPQPSYLPDLAPSDSALFPKLKIKLEGSNFETLADIQKESTELRKMVFFNHRKIDGIIVYVFSGCYFEGDGSQNCSS
jgi:hypothetical protein